MYRGVFGIFGFILSLFFTENKVQLYASSHSIATTHYILKKYLDEKSLREILPGFYTGHLH